MVRPLWRSYLLLMLLAACLPGCQKTDQPQSEASKPVEGARASADRAAKSAKVVLALFDVSGSTLGRRQQYQADFDRILGDDAGKMPGHLKGGDCLIADRITENPLAQSSFPVQVEFPTYSVFSSHELKHKAEMRRCLGQARSGVATILAGDETKDGKRPKMTRILDALVLAERVFGNYPGRRHVLVVFSDMIEQSPQHDFSEEKLTPQKIEALISAQKDATGALPNLQGVETYVTGACAAETGGLPPEQAMSIQSFWLTYLAKCGAHLPRERYGSSLIAFGE